MKKVFFLVLILCLGVAGYFGYNRYLQPQVTNIWSLIPQNAIVVYETDRFHTVWDELKSKKFWKTLSSIPKIKKLNEDLEALNESKKNPGLIEVLTNNNKIAIALFPINKSEIGGLYVLQINNIDQHAALSDLLEKNYKRRTRKYNGFTISELTNKNNGEKFSFVFHKNFFMGSSTPFLLEDAIRAINSNASFKQGHEELFNLVRLQKDEGNLYVNSSKMKEIADLFYSGTKAEIEIFSNIASSTFLDISSSDSEIQLDGFSHIKKSKDLLNIFEGNPGSSFQIANFISNDAMYLAHYSFQNPTLFLSKLKEYREQYEADFPNSLTQLSKYDVTLDDFNQWLGNEIGFYQTNNGNEKFLIVKTQDNILANKQLSEISSRVATINGDSVYSEIYQQYEITFFPLEKFPQLMFGSNFSGFKDVFYLSMGDKLIFSNDLQALKNLIEDIADENTWGKSLKFNQFLESINKDSNLSYLVNTRNAWKPILDALNKDWKKLFVENELIIKEFELFGIQFSNVDEKYFTNVNFIHPGEFKERKGSSTLQPKITLTFDYGLSIKPKIVRNHTNNTREILVQDSSSKIYLLSKDFDVLWLDSLSGNISTDIHQVDYFNNGKLQYLFATGNQINLIDRKGNSVGNYPISVNEKDIATLNVIDYNKTKKYRWAISDVSGNLFLLDKKGKKLKNWGPNKKKYKLNSNIKHTRILGKDLIMICLEQGVFDIINRRGTSYPGFPINFDKDIDLQYILKPSSSFNKSSSTFITKDGEIIKVNLRGKFLKRDQLIEGSKNAVYSFVKDISSNKYVISVIDRKKISILNGNGDPKFEKEYINNGDVLVQYYYFEAGNELIIITDLLQEFTYLYDGNGNLINSIPIENNQEVSVLYARRKKEIEMFTNFRNRIDKYIFPAN